MVSTQRATTHSPLNIFAHGTVGLAAKMPPTLVRSRAKSAVQGDVYSRHMAWLDWLVERTGKTLSALARDAGVSPNLLTRKKADGGLLSGATIELLTATTELPGPDTYLLPSSGMAEDAVPYDSSAPGVDPLIKQMIALALKGRANAAPWHLQTRALEGAGYFPGDVVITDNSVRAYAGDAVVAQHYQAGGATTIFRVYEAPYLVSYSGETPRREPMLVDDRTTIVMGPITHSFRARRR